MAAENVCLFLKYGYCKFLEKCKYNHEQRVCENESCEIENCLLRHPRQCRYWKEFEMCKFGDYCFFSHKTIGNAKSIFEKEGLVHKIDALGKEVIDSKIKIEQLETIGILQSEKIDTLDKELKEKECKLEDINFKIREIAKTLERLEATSSSSSSFRSSSSTEKPSQSSNTLSTNPTSLASCSLMKTTVETPTCCEHRCAPGRRSYNFPNRPPDGSQCCYHKCKNNHHFITKKP